MAHTRACALAHLPSWQYYAPLAAYHVIHLIHLPAIVSQFTRHMGDLKLSKSAGRTSKLVTALGAAPRPA